MSATKKEILKIIHDDRLTISFVIGLFLLVTDFYVKIGLSVFGFILIFNYFDMLGYRNVLRSMQSETVDTFQLASYRVMQFVFEWTLLALIGLGTHWWFIILAKMLHLAAWQDIVYYYIGKYEMPEYWTWLSWTVIGWFWKEKDDRGKKKIPHKVVMKQAVSMLLIVIAILILVQVL